MGCEELAHLEFFLGLGVLVVVGEVVLFQPVQAAYAGIAVVDGLRRQLSVALVDGEQDLFVVFRAFVLRNMLRNDGIAHCSLRFRV